MIRSDMIRSVLYGFCIICSVGIVLVCSACADQRQISLQEYPATTNAGSEEDRETTMDQDPSVRPEQEPVLDKTGGADSISATEEELCVFICGCVTEPGVYYLAGGSRICDGIRAAGGLTDEADINAVNQARLLSDGEKIYIPAIGEEYLEQEQGASSGLINLNHASKEELLTLPGIGNSKAEAILEYRDQHGGYQSKEELMNITGIKEGTYDKLEPLITVD